MKPSGSTPNSSLQAPTRSSKSFAAAACATLTAVLMTACSSTAQIPEQRYTAKADFTRAYVPQGELDRTPKQVAGSVVETKHKLEGIAHDVVFDATAQFLVDEQGFTREVQCVSASNEALARALESTIAKWRFDPATKDGKPTVAKVTVAFDSTKATRFGPVADLKGPGPQPVNY